MKRIALNILCAALLIIAVLSIIWYANNKKSTVNSGIEDNKLIDPNTIYLSGSGVEVNFGEVLLYDMEESRNLIVATQKATVDYTLTDRLIKILDIDILNKSKTINYEGTGLFVVPLDKLKKQDIIQDNENKTVTIKIDHARLQAIDIDPNKIVIGDTKRGLFAFGDIKLIVEDYWEIEKGLRTRLENKFNTAYNGQKADENALKMVKEIYEPVVQAIDGRYSVVVEFK